MTNVMENEKPPQCSELDACYPLYYLNIKRNTCQCIVLIYYNVNEADHGKFRNVMIAHNPIMRAYGNGEFIGLSKDICCVEGVFPTTQNLGLLIFDHVDEATKCIESKPELREPHYYGGRELYILPLCNPAQSWPGYRYMQLDVYEPKNATVFSKYMNQLVPIVTKYGGHVIAGSSQSGRFMSLRRAIFIFMVQWRSREAFFACNAEIDRLFCPKPPTPPPVDSNIMTQFPDCVRARQEINKCRCDVNNNLKKVTPLQRESGAACTSRIIFELDTQHFNWC